jgi:hypothetical protein
VLGGNRDRRDRSRDTEPEKHHFSPFTALDQKQVTAAAGSARTPVWSKNQAARE